MGKRGLILCVCQGLCPSFKKMDIFEVINAVRKEKIVDFVSIHPQLCVEDGDEYLKVLLANKDIDKLYIAACDPVMQRKMFHDALAASGFDTSKHIALDIRNKTTEEAVEAIKKMVSDNP